MTGGVRHGLMNKIDWLKKKTAPDCFVRKGTKNEISAKKRENYWIMSRVWILNFFFFIQNIGTFFIFKFPILFKTKSCQVYLRKSLECGKL